MMYQKVNHRNLIIKQCYAQYGRKSKNGRYNLIRLECIPGSREYNTIITQQIWTRPFTPP